MVANSSLLLRAIQWALAFLLALCLANSAHADQVTAALDKNVVAENEVVQLTIRTDFTNTGNGPDLTPLKRDFEILGRSQNSQFSFNLGTNQALNFWVVTLMPKAVGNFQIPPIQVGDKASEALYLEVKPAQQMTDRNGNPLVMLKFKANKTEPYVQEQVLITLELYSAVNIQSASLSMPNHPNLVTERLTDDQMRYEEINGTSYQIMTREYVAFPQRSGMLELSNQSIEGLVNTRNGTRKINVKSQPITLNVLPIPASYGNSNWLPTDAVAIRSTISNTVSNPRVGDTLIWEIDITAQGVLGEQLPTLNFASTRAYKLYPTSPSFESSTSINGVTGRQSMRIEVVPTQSGPLELPTVEINYWDPVSRSVKSASAKAPAVDIAPLPGTTETPNTNISAPLASSDANSDNQTQNLPPQSSSVAPISLAKPKAAPQTEQANSDQNAPAPLEVVVQSEEDDSNAWKGFLAAALIGIGVIGIGAWLWVRRKNHSKAPTGDEVPTLQEFAPLSSANETLAYQALINGCRDNNLATLRLNLLEWARHRWGDNTIRGVDDIKRLADTPHLTQLLMEAELVMYSHTAATQWNGNALADALEEYVTGEKKPSQASQLKTLYPNF
ncbi:BatD family protein [Marinomonas fungiae]|uniref:Oxygen tolerance n=1 Tax=Marinomonas fungiae TaxID=1137284 RepID=A0A0K6IGC5_9GAMM|nr:BatD family protein [Marinomonas fungiae]CUB02210.1 Oxygen tolerance [Marinomonas fungiae]